MIYIGRFAPSPTGPLHFGSLVAAIASYLEAKSNQGKWLVRMEDLDKPREMPEAASGILQTLESYGFEWDNEVVYQSQRSPFYQDALEEIKSQSLIYACSCSRKEIADSASHGIEGLIYPGTCRHLQRTSSVFSSHPSSLPSPAASRPSSLRIKVNDDLITFDDAIQGFQQQQLQRDIGDFVLKRADNIFAYQLAVVVDDALQGITHIVRGADLLISTPRQIYLQGVLGYPQPQYAHVPLAINHNGEKLSKQTLALPLKTEHAPDQLWRALAFLGQQPPAVLKDANLGEIWQWAQQHWQIKNVSPHNALAT